MRDEPSGHRWVDPAIFATAPRFHTGIGPGEFPAVLQDGGVFTRKQMANLAPASAVRGSGGASQQQVNIHNYSGSDVKTRRRQSGNESIVDVVIGAVVDGMATGKLDGPMQARFGSRVKPITR